MDVLTVAAVLSLLSVSAAKPLNCEGLDQPLALNETQISGKWIFTEGTTDQPEICYNTENSEQLLYGHCHVT
uniref:Uncharacterized protein n=1 Tax=Anguilla anguilla TaxID=7936 RepID=A0A0E9VCF3_ANGAN